MVLGRYNHVARRELSLLCFLVVIIESYGVQGMRRMSAPNLTYGTSAQDEHEKKYKYYAQSSKFIKFSGDTSQNKRWVYITHHGVPCFIVVPEDAYNAYCNREKRETALARNRLYNLEQALNRDWYRSPGYREVQQYKKDREHDIASLYNQLNQMIYKDAGAAELELEKLCGQEPARIIAAYAALPSNYARILQWAQAKKEIGSSLVPRQIPSRTIYYDIRCLGIEEGSEARFLLTQFLRFLDEPCKVAAQKISRELEGDSNLLFAYLGYRPAFLVVGYLGKYEHCCVDAAGNVPDVSIFISYLMHHTYNDQSGIADKIDDGRKAIQYSKNLYEETYYTKYEAARLGFITWREAIMKTLNAKMSYGIEQITQEELIQSAYRMDFVPE